MNSKDVLVSICTLTYNHEDFIVQCLDGLLMQKTNFRFEILIHDDASIDSTARIIKKYESNCPGIIKPIYQTENQYSKGVRPIFKYLFPKAKGKYIAICEGDDYWTDPYKLQKQVDFLELNEEYSGAASFHSSYYVESDYLFKEKEPNKTIVTLSDLISNMPFHTSTFLYRNFYNKPFDTSPVFSGDRRLFMTIACYGDIKIIESYTSVHVKHSNGVSSHVTSKQMMLDLNIVKGIKKRQPTFNEHEFQIKMLEKLFVRSKTIYLNDYIKATFIYIQFMFSGKTNQNLWWHFKNLFNLLKEGLRKLEFNQKTFSI